MKKIFGAIAVALAVLGSGFAFSACSDGGHTEHDFTGAWVTTDPEYHWHVCATDGCEETDMKVAHEWVDDESKTDVPATCIADGIHYLKCECGAKKSEAITTRPDHDFSGAWVTTDTEYHWHVCATDGCGETDMKVAHEWVDDESKTDVPATCIADGIHYVKCSVCGKEKSNPITNRPEHSFTGALVNTDATGHYHVCATAGCDETDEKQPHVCNQYEKVDDNVHSKTCVCGYSVNESHAWDEGVVTKEPSETEKGIKTYTCGVCHGTKTEAIPETSHSHTPSVDWANDGTSHWHTCSGCTEKLDKADHSWNEGEVTTQPTCTTKGVKTYTCTVCDKTKTEEIEENPHDFSGAWITTDPEYHWHVCANDGCEETDTKVAHEWVDDGSKTDVPATCHSDGIHYVKCSVCGKEKSEAITDRPDHDYTGQPYISDGANGHYQECKECRAHSETVAHSLVDGATVTEPTFWAAGSKNVTCEHCDYAGTATIERLDTADFAKDFSLDAEHKGSWSYGKVEYIWDVDNNEANGKQEDFTFTAATDKNEGGDGWVIGSCEIKDGFVNSDNWATVAFTFTEDTAATVNFTFTGNYVIVGKDPDTGEDIKGDPNTFNCRIGVKDKDGKIYSNPTFMEGAGDPNVCAHTAQYNFKAGDTIYFMIEHTGGWASGTLELTITRNAANAE